MQGVQVMDRSHSLLESFAVVTADDEKSSAEDEVEDEEEDSDINTSMLLQRRFCQ
jgi:hypothetical protein